MGGQVVVIHLVLIYHMSVNILRGSIKRNLHGLFSCFLWEGSVDKKNMHLVNWESVTTPIYQGGLGILNLGEMNKTLAPKWIFSYTNNKDALWKKVACANTKDDPNSLMLAQFGFLLMKYLGLQLGGIQRDTWG